MAQVLGLISLHWLGNEIDIKPGGTLKLGGLVNKAVVYGQKVGNAQMMEASEVSCKAIVTAGMVVTTTFNVGQVGELQAQCDTGQTFVWESAFVEGAVTLTAGENSEVDVKWGAGAPMETTAA